MIVVNNLEILKKINKHIYLELESRAGSSNGYDRNWTSEIYKINKEGIDSVTIYFKDDDQQKDSLQYSLK